MEVNYSGLDDELVKEIKLRGGIFNPEDLDFYPVEVVEIINALELRVNYVSLNYYSVNPVVLKLGIIQDCNVGGFAYSTAVPIEDEAKYDFIGINLGTIWVAVDLCLRLMCVPSMLPHIGDVSRQTSKGYQDHKLIDQRVLSGRSLCVPECVVRKNYGLRLALCVIDLIFFHEFSHIKNGHLEYIAGLNKLPFISECSEDVPDVGEYSVIQTLEWDADCTANSLFVNFVHSTMTKHFARIYPGDRESFELAYQTIPKIFCLMGLASTLCFRMMEGPCWDFEEQMKVTHPYHCLRQNTGFGLLVQHAQIRYKQKVGGAYSEIVFRAYISVEEGIASILGKSVDVSRTQSVLEQHENVSTYLRAMSEQWKVIRPALLPNIRGGPFAP
ncbi:hypothetical protein M5G22_13465 [Pseudomonas sp. TNT2022 ID233]|uniref:hypothetical protein n=1 Tax=Pseudomonas aphyarum TaxID=2942629 RepID=UPI0023619A17|nr:hypothetical protein [Pseudomonas aphyarum]MDD1138556.1 hypothetical protein [Pseudomonas aphyarum]